MGRKNKNFHSKQNVFTDVWDCSPIMDGILDMFEMRIKKVAKTKSKVQERLKDILRYLTLIRKYISQNDTRRAVMATICFEGELSQSGYKLPLNFLLASSKGGQADKRKRGILMAIEEKLGKMKGKPSAQQMWRFFKSQHYDETNAYITHDSKYRIFFYVDLLFQQDMNDDKESSIKFKTFQRYFYDVLKK